VIQSKFGVCESERNPATARCQGSPSGKRTSPWKGSFIFEGLPTALVPKNTQGYGIDHLYPGEDQRSALAPGRGTTAEEQLRLDLPSERVRKGQIADRRRKKRQSTGL